MLTLEWEVKEKIKETNRCLDRVLTKKQKLTRIKSNPQSPETNINNKILQARKEEQPSVLPLRDKDW